MREAWDAYDVQGNLLGFDLYRGEPIPEGVYHLVVEIYVFSKDGKVLSTQRHPGKPMFPLKWEVTGGAVQKGETPGQGALRELREETGICAAPEQLHAVYSMVRNHAIFHSYAVLVDRDVPIKLQEGETVAYQWLDYETFLALVDSGDFVDTLRDRFLEHREKVEAVRGWLLAAVEKRMGEN